MKHLVSDLGMVEQGKTAKVTLNGSACNVLLLDNGNYDKYKRGSSYRYFGGYFTKSPAAITIPAAGRWYMVVDLGNGKGNVTATNPRIV